MTSVGSTSEGNVKRPCRAISSPRSTRIAVAPAAAMPNSMEGDTGRRLATASGRPRPVSSPRRSASSPVSCRHAAAVQPLREEPAQVLARHLLHHAAQVVGRRVPVLVAPVVVADAAPERAPCRSGRAACAASSRPSGRPAGSAPARMSARLRVDDRRVGQSSARARGTRVAAARQGPRTNASRPSSCSVKSSVK